MKEFTGGRGADVVFDPVGGDTFDGSTRCVGFEGRIVVVGFAGGRIAQARTNHLLVKNYDVLGLHWGLYRRWSPNLVDSVHQKLTALMADGSVRPYVSERLPLDRAAEGIDRFESRRVMGRVVVLPQVETSGGSELRVR